MVVWIMVGVTFREAARKKILWIGLLVGIAVLTLFGIGMHFQIKDFNTRAVPPFLRYQIMSGIFQVGFYAVDFLAVVMTVLTSVDTISGEINSGTIQAIATKPISRWQVLIGKWIGFISMAGAYLTLMFGGLVGVGYWIALLVPQNPIRGASLIFLECILVLTVTFLFGTWFSSLATGVLVLGLHGLAFIGGWIEQIGGFAHSPRLVTLGIVSSLIMPSESMWRRAIFEMQSPISGSLPFGPFSNASAPSVAMIVYALAYTLVTLALAIHHFNQRDL
jgi:ABC-type transport system involved in multi-copper enzyme maturation permease subunit